MIPIFIAKIVGKIALKEIIKADDKRIARKHHKEIKELKKQHKEMRKEIDMLKGG
tara:strand:- start:217 stop:381 length:165 start_codon:yes stop_codon:yes gene_type:complete